jgi:hypothetical protein
VEYTVFFSIATYSLFDGRCGTQLAERPLARGRL